MISLYVDDLGIAAPDMVNVNEIRSALLSKFKMTDEGDINYILGMKITRDRKNRTISLSSESKAVEILKDFNMVDCVAVNTPMESLTVSNLDCPAPNSPEWNQMQSVPYRECVGRLTHLMRTTRPDLAFSISVVSRYLHNPGLKHWNLVKRILKYLKGTSKLALTLSPSTDSDPLKLSGFVDSDWAGGENLKSTSGYCFKLGNSLVSWSSKIQSLTATSSTHAEYVAAYYATSELLWARSFLIELGTLKPFKSTTLKCDNQAAIKIASNHITTPRSKHFDIKHHFVREKVADGVLNLEYCPGSLNVADIFTKPLASNKFVEFRSQLGLKMSYW
jgi:aspartate carbamoyltransferase regulatory subunit